MTCSHGMIRGAVCTMGNAAYFNPIVSCHIFYYDYHVKQWVELPQCSSLNFAFVVINDQLTTVGGFDSNKLFGYSEGVWKETFPPMSTNREFPAAVCTGHYVVVAGGQDGRKALASVEVMDTNSQQWFTAASLPRRIHQASMTVCGDMLYILGDGTTEVHYCSIQNLLESCTGSMNQSTLLAKIKGLMRPENPPSSLQVNVWMRLKDLPVCSSTAVTLCGQLICVGGHDNKDKKNVDNVYCYNASTSSWKVIGQIPLKNSYTLAATLPGDKLIIVSGGGNISIDIASCVMSEL